MGKNRANIWMVRVEREVDKKVTKSSSNIESFWFVTETEADQKIKELYERQRSEDTD